MAEELVVYGIANCDTVKRARQWLDAQGLAYRFVDFKKSPPVAQHVAAWAHCFGWELLVNKRGTTWRKLEAVEQAAVVDAASAADLLVRHPSAIRRPVVERGGEALLLGFDAPQWSRALL
ncbi:MAG: Spx/MgsR family RNA polymerase-binding regulatory protein [Thiomonas sp.]